MDNISKYIYQVYLNQSFSEAAKKLYISQPSLSTAVGAKEKELGFKIFNRGTKPISLTREGELYIEMLEEIFHSENLMFLRVKRLSNKESSVITVGAVNYSSHFFLPTVCGYFFRRYPNIEVKLDVGQYDSKGLFYERLDNGKTDVIFSYNYDKKQYVGYPVFDEQLVIAMHKNLVTDQLLDFSITREELLNKSYSQEKVILDNLLFQNVSFLSFPKGSPSGSYMLDFLGHYLPASHRVVNFKYSGVHLNMMRAGLGAILTSDYMVRLAILSSEDILYFVLPKEVSKRTLFAVLRKNDEPDEIVLKFIETAKDVASNGNTIPLYYE